MITVIIPVKDEKENLFKLLPYLESIAAGHSFEVVVACSQNCKADYSSIPCTERVIFIRCKHEGRAPQMNEAADLASGNILAFLHADARPPITFFADIEQSLSGKFDAGFFSYQFDKDRFLLRINASTTYRKGIFTGGGDQCLFIHRDVFERLGKFKDDQLFMEDFEFYKRLKKSKVNFTIVQHPLTISARKYDKNSYVRVNLSNLLVLLLFKCGYPSKKLRSIYAKLIRS